MTLSLSQLSAATPYAAYAYSYPHKTAYRPLSPTRLLSDVWKPQDKSSLFLYLHVPFCEMRCGFCNLFTTANPRDELCEAYVSALWRHATRVRRQVGPGRYTRMAIGGGTPTFLSTVQLERVFAVAGDLFDVDLAQTPTSVETSPRTAEPDKLRLMRDRGVTRVSIGVQSFVEAEVASSGRAQRNLWVDDAIGRIRALDFPCLNIDLIYGLPGQTVRSWEHSLKAALRWNPEELYLYPLYVRPLTGLDRRGAQAEDELRLSCYRAGRELLLAHGYEQVSMRMFRRIDAAAGDQPAYCCQEDGMVGLGCGARSYTAALHYSTEYAVGAPGVREIIDGYIEKPDEAFDVADYGCELDEAEQKRRWVIKSLLRSQGLSLADYHERFSSDATQDVPELLELEAGGLITQDEPGLLKPTPAGLERSDAMGPWLYSRSMLDRMDHFALR